MFGTSVIDYPKYLSRNGGGAEIAGVDNEGVDKYGGSCRGGHRRSAQ